MAYIKINTKYPVYDGMPLTFEAPCDCTAVEGLSVNSTNYVFKDAHGVSLAGLGNLFEAGAYVKVILDATNRFAYIQNADTNSYLENKITYGTTDLVAGSSPLKTGTLYVVYE